MVSYAQCYTILECYGSLAQLFSAHIAIHRYPKSSNTITLSAKMLRKVTRPFSPPTTREMWSGYTRLSGQHTNNTW